MESCKAQTYENIELTFSDDASTDDMVEICKIWIQESKKRFVNIRIVTLDKNSGVSANVNRGVNASTGVWFKLVARDDLLFESCIQWKVEFINNLTKVGPDPSVLSSKIKYFKCCICICIYHLVSDFTMDR